MPDIREKYFVNRDYQLDAHKKALNKMLDARILSVKKENGWGKSWLLYKLERISKEMRWPVAFIEDLGDVGVRHAWQFLTQVRNQMGKERLPALDQEIKKHKGGERTFNIHLSGDAGSRGINISGEGHKITFEKDVVAGHLIKLPDKMNEVERMEYENDLTRAFFNDIQDLQPPVQGALILDQYEAIDEDEQDGMDSWLKTRLFPAILEDEITNLVVVIAGTKVPDFSDDKWKLAVEEIELDPLLEKDLQEYLAHRRELPDDAVKIIKFLSKNESPQWVSTQADKYDQKLKK